jgi:HlyD family secretion protein
MNRKLLLLLFLGVQLVISFSCQQGKELSDAYGNFEAEEVMISAEISGKLIRFDLEEGAVADSGLWLGQIDSMQYYLKLKQLKAQRRAVETRNGNIQAQVQVQAEQLKSLQVEKNRLKELFANQAATQRQLDDIDGRIRVVESTISSIRTQNPAVFSELEALDMQMAQMEDMLAKCRIICPMKGTVLEKYVEAYEVVAAGKPLFKMANVENLILRVYISGNQLSQVTIGQTLEVLVDDHREGLRKIQGTVMWVSPQAEFTPKIIQTRDERVNLVYAVKLRVPNDGNLKIGMPGEIRFSH